MHAVNGISDGGSIAMINSETLAAVSLLPGSYPQRTGRRLGAEVDLVTREGRRDRFHARAGLSGTSATFSAKGVRPRTGFVARLGPPKLPGLRDQENRS